MNVSLTPRIWFVLFALLAPQMGHAQDAQASTYENAGSPGFPHTDFGLHTEALGLMKNFPVPGVKWLTGYKWIQGGIGSFTGYAQVENRLYDGESLGLIVHFNEKNSIGFRRGTTRL